ncbi:hypothetical protein E4U54_004486 [Claviceps lovelessii]|nr:hypothetical protein E4U54_004486 [Claviceps lovelessii]
MSPSSSRLPVIRIAKGTFYRQFPSPQASSSSSSSSSHANPSLFDDLTFELPSSSRQPHNWCIVGPSLAGKTTFLQILRGRLLCVPPTARSYPYLLARETPIPARRRVPQQAVRYVGFDTEATTATTGASVTTSAFLSARYESWREITDFSVRDFLLGNTELNPLARTSSSSSSSSSTLGREDVDKDECEQGEDEEGTIPMALLDRVVRDLGLDGLLDLPVTFLSNGQGRRARIARALMTRPEVLLLDEPFLGLDPPTVSRLSVLLQSLADKARPRLVLSARPQDPLPEWITHLVYLRSDCQIESMGSKDVVLDGLRKYVKGVRLGGLVEDEKLPIHTLTDIGRVLGSSRMWNAAADLSKGGEEKKKEKGEDHVVHVLTPVNPDAEPLIEMEGCRVRYGDKIVLGNWSQQTTRQGRGRDSGPQKDGLIWTVRRGERWGIFGPNGSGKTTLVSLVSSDHPQAYSMPIRIFGQSRLPDPASSGSKRPLTFWDIQARVGHSSPEVHQHMPRSHSVRNVIENAWAATFRSQPKLDGPAKQRVDAALRWFAPELNLKQQQQQHHLSHSHSPLSWADETTFGELSFPAQRVALFIRSIIKSTDVVVLDEAFSGMDDAVRDKCALFLVEGEHKTYRAAATAAGGGSRRDIVPSEQSERGTVVMGGLSDQQALICIAHVKEEVPDCVREWMCLPEANSGRPPRFGRLDGPLGGDERRWEEVWGV